MCREAKIEFGEEIASKLKLTADGTKVLWPQPTDDPEDPQNVRNTNIHVFSYIAIDYVCSGRTSARTCSCS